MRDNLNKYLMKSTVIVTSIISTVLALTIIIYLYFVKIEYSPKIELISITITMIAIMLGMTLAVLSKYTFFKRKKASVFISYDNNNKDFAIKLSNDLIEYEFEPILMDNIILIGDNIEDKIFEFIKSADLFVLIIPKDFKESDFIKKELSFAKENKKKIFPIIFNDVKLPSELESIKYGDFRKDYSNQLKLLIKSMEMNLK